MKVEPSQETKRWYRVGMVKCAMLALVYAVICGYAVYRNPFHHNVQPYFLWFMGCYGLALLGYIAVLRDLRTLRRASWYTQLLIYASLIGIPKTWTSIMGIAVLASVFMQLAGLVVAFSIAFILYGLWLSPLMLMWKYQMYYHHFRYRKWLI